MSPLNWFKKEKPMLSMQSMGGGAAGYMISGAPPAIDASGGTKTTPGDGYVYHQFLGGGTFAVANAGKGSDGVIDVCIVGGGGGGSLDGGGGGGGGGFRITTVDIADYGAGNYPVSVGAGGNGQPSTGPSPSRPPAGDGGSSSFNIPSSITPSPISIICGGGGGGGPLNPSTTKVGRPGQPYPFPTASPPHPNATIYPGSGGGANKSGPYGGYGASSPNNSPKAFNSGSGRKGFGSYGGGGGGASGDGGIPVASTPAVDARPGAQLPWALPTWGWGQYNSAGLSGQAPTSPDPTRPAGPGGELPWGYGYFAGGGGGGGQSPGSLGGYGRSGGGNGSTLNNPYGGPPNSGGDGHGYWAAPGTGSGGGGSGPSGSVSPPIGGGQGAPGAVMIRYPVG